MIQKIKSGYKAVTVFVLGLGGFLTFALADHDVQAALPDGPEKWLVVVGIPAIIAAGGWLTRNQPTVDEAAEAYEKAKARALSGKS